MNKQEIEKAIVAIKLLFDYNVYGIKEHHVRTALECMQQQLNNGWIPVSERLPEESIDGITDDYVSYNVSLKFEYAECTRTYKFGNGRWWNDGTDMSEYAVAWQPLPEPYKEVSDAERD